MDCLSVGACSASGVGGTGRVDAAGTARYSESERAQRFAELLETEPARNNVYGTVAPPSGSGGNQAVSIVSMFRSLEPSPALGPLGSSSADQLVADPVEAIRNLTEAQMEVLRTTMMLAVVSTAKNGVTTLFQQQG